MSKLLSAEELASIKAWIASNPYVLEDRTEAWYALGEIDGPDSYRGIDELLYALFSHINVQSERIIELEWLADSLIDDMGRMHRIISSNEHSE